MKMLTICKRELKEYFYSAQAYMLIGFFLLIVGFLFAGSLSEYAFSEIQYYTGSFAIMFIFITPILTMKLFTEEKKNGTDKLLFSSPISVFDIVLGKFLAALTVILVALAITTIYIIIISFLGKVALGPVFASYLGLILLSSSFISVGIFASCLTENQIISGIISFAILILLWFSKFLQSVFTNVPKTILNLLDVLKPFLNFLAGAIRVADIFYYISFTGIFLFLTIRIIKSKWMK